MSLTTASCLKHPVVSLLICFVIWKALLFAVVLLTPGPSYDTSTSLVLGHEEETTGRRHGSFSSLHASLQTVVGRLVRWDAIYYSTTAHRGYQHEQEWAFGYGFTRVIAYLSHLFFPDPSIQTISLVAVTASTISHLLSVFLLYKLTQFLCPRKVRQHVALLAAILHVITPAGLFMSAPYGESLSSLLNFSGMLFYCWSVHVTGGAHQKSAIHDLWLVAAGCAFGLASMVRSNGIFSGTIFAQDLLSLLYKMWSSGIEHGRIRRCAAIVVGGCLVAIGFAYPQVVAYQEYCTGHTALRVERPWCSRMPPSIYTFVQGFYWNVGFLRYWTLSNLPLFALAGPTLGLMLVSGTSGALGHLWKQRLSARGKPSEEERQSTKDVALMRHCVQRFAVPQLVLTVLALTSFHVQIITRIATAYPLLFVWVAKAIVEKRRVWILGKQRELSKGLVRWMIMYGTIQAGLFASFLPPA